MFSVVNHYSGQPVTFQDANSEMECAWGAPTSSPRVLCAMGVALFVLDVLILCLSVGQIVTFVASAPPEVEWQSVVGWVSHAMVAAALALHRWPLVMASE